MAGMHSRDGGVRSGNRRLRPALVPVAISSLLLVVAPAMAIGSHDDPTAASGTGTARPASLPKFQQVSFWSKTSKVPVRSHSDHGPVELGMRFTPARNGWVAGVRFYKPAREQGRHVASLWDARGRLLASAEFSGESRSGWQEVSFAKPVFVWGGHDYTVSYHSENGTYVRTAGFRAISAGPLRTTSRGGVIGYGDRGFPSQGDARRYNYWVDVIFRWDPWNSWTSPSGAPSPAPSTTPTAPGTPPATPTSPSDEP
ncbi:DUF4082 domain-containing protein, partial [Planotetraspora silvatica]